MVIDTAGVTLPHGLEYPLSGLLNVTHGHGLAALIVPVMEYTCLAAAEKCRNITAAMGENVEGLSVEEAAVKSVEAVKKLLQKINLTVTLRELGVAESDIEWLSSNALKTMMYAISNNPKVPDLNEIKEIYKKCL